MHSDRKETIATTSSTVVRHWRGWQAWLVLACIGLPSLGFAAVSGLFNANYAAHFGHTDQERITWMAASVLITCFVTGLPLAIEILRIRVPHLAVAVRALWVASMAFSFVAAMGYAALTRGEAIAEANVDLKNRADRERAIARSEAELAALPQHRPATVVEAELRKSEAEAGVNCNRIRGRMAQTACAPVLTLRTELAAAEEANRLHRVPVDGDKRGRRSGAYIGHLEGSCPAGYIQNFKTGLAHNWKAQSGAEALSAVDRSRLYEESRARQAECERRLQAIHTETIRLIEAHLVDTPPPPADHPYLVAKGVGGHGLFLDVAGPLCLRAGGDTPHHWSARGNLLVPICDIDGQLLSAQSIDAEGNKAFPRGARWLGGMHVIGTIEDGRAPIVIVEGYATGATLHEATGMTVAVAFNAGNLESVARSLRNAHPDALLIIAGDNDHQKAHELMPDGQPKPNAGRVAAEKAAAAVGGFALLPVFAVADPGSDWNDLAAAKGRQALAEQWQTGMVTIQRQVASEAIAAEREFVAEAQADIQLAQKAAQGAHR